MTLGAGGALLARQGWPRPAGLAWQPAAAAVILMVLANDAVCGLRWNLFRSPRGGDWEAIRRYAEAAMLSTLLPLAGDAWRARGGRRSLDGVALDRLISGSVIALCAVAAACALTYKVATVAVAAAPVLALAAGWGLIRRRLGLQQVPASALAAAAALSLLYVVLAALAFLLAFAAAGVRADVEHTVLVTPLVLLAAAVPSIAGLGPGAALLGWVAALAGATPGQTYSIVGLLVIGQLAVWLLGWISLAARGRKAAR